MEWGTESAMASWVHYIIGDSGFALKTIVNVFIDSILRCNFNYVCKEKICIEKSLAIFIWGGSLKVEETLKK